MQDPIQTRPTNLASTSPRDPLAVHEAHLTPLIHARLGVREPEPLGQLRADTLAAPVCRRVPAHRLMAVRWASDGETPGHGAPASRSRSCLARSRNSASSACRWAQSRPDLNQVDSDGAGRWPAAPGGC